jgi:hypothetical protein
VVRKTGELGQTRPHVDDELGRLAGVVIARVSQPIRPAVDRAECWQTAYAAGLQAVRAAERARRHTSSHFLILAMQSAVYRLLHRNRRELREADLRDLRLTR